LRLLHLYAGPFPTNQGTQALVGQICRGLAAAGHEVHLLAYAHGRESAFGPFTVHRIPDRPRFRSERSFPHPVKALLDLRMSAECARLLGELRPDIVDAHHYEALLAARLADPRRRVPLVFHLHARLGPELETYLPGRLAGPARLMGAAIDRFLPRLADRVVAVDRESVRLLIAGGLPARRVTWVPPPADVPRIPARPSRCPGDRVRAVYAGNLDAYQGLDRLLDGLARLGPAARAVLEVEVITASEPSGFEARARALGLGDLVRVTAHGPFERAWPRVASADIALVPRSLGGGAPIKLVNALAAGQAVLADQRVAGYLAHGEEAWLVDMRDPSAIAAAVERLAGDELLRTRLGRGATRVAARLHSAEAATRALEQIYLHASDR